MHKEASLFDDSLTRSGEILTKGFLPDSVSTALTFVLGHGKQNMNSSCNWSNFGEIWQKSRKSDEYKLRSCKRDISVVEDINISTDIEEISRSCFDSTIKKMHATSSPIKDGFVYKRRKMQRNTVALLSGENAVEVTEENTVSEFNLSSSDYHLAVHEDSSDDVQAAVYLSNDCQDNERPSFSGRHHFDVHASLNSQLIDNKNLEFVKKCVNNDHSSARDVSYSAEGFTNKLCCSSTENCSTTNGTTFAATKYCVPCASISTAAGEHSEDCSTSGAIFLESLEKFESPEEMCIYVLRRHGLLGESSRKSACVSSENLGFVGPLFSPCKICSISESALKMLICDDCEEAFHLSCCRPKIKRLPRDEWYCQSCFRKKRKHLLKKNMGTSSGNVGDVSESGGPIASMLRDIGPHRSRVRIGEDFQVDVPDWTDLFSNDEYFDEPKEMDHADLCSFEGWSWSMSSKSHTIGNWLQCKDEDDNGNICGKWRRAPIFCVQTDDWDCSCAVLWDPIHADCAVPQELDTEEVLKHLKYVEMLKDRMNNRK